MTMIETLALQDSTQTMQHKSQYQKSRTPSLQPVGSPLSSSGIPLHVIRPPCCLRQLAHYLHHLLGFLMKVKAA